MTFMAHGGHSLSQSRRPEFWLCKSSDDPYSAGVLSAVELQIGCKELRILFTLSGSFEFFRS
jgi:hypothetical protein